METNKNIFLIGFMGCGKSTIARLLADTLSMELIEMDGTIEQEEGRTINEIFATDGETYFRDLESAYIARIRDKGNAMVSCGGGAILREENVVNMKKNGTVLYLSATPETIYERVRYSTNRPLLKGNMNVGYISELMSKRVEKYEKAADLILCVDGKSVEEIAAEIQSQI